jgi:hypothetical protein
MPVHRGDHRHFDIEHAEERPVAAERCFVRQLVATLEQRAPEIRPRTEARAIAGDDHAAHFAIGLHAIDHALERGQEFGRHCVAVVRAVEGDRLPRVGSISSPRSDAAVQPRWSLSRRLPPENDRCRRTRISSTMSAKVKFRGRPAVRQENCQGLLSAAGVIRQARVERQRATPANAAKSLRRVGELPSGLW